MEQLEPGGGKGRAQSADPEPGQSAPRLVRAPVSEAQRSMEPSQTLSHGISCHRTQSTRNEETKELVCRVQLELLLACGFILRTSMKGMEFVNGVLTLCFENVNVY